jgi:CRISPR-associated protein Csm4
MIQTYKIFKLHFHSPLHLSKGKEDDYGESEQVLHSDTLKSALYVCARKLFGGEAIGDDDSFFKRFRISSAFPFYEGELFFPKPMLRLQPFDTNEISEEKQGKSHKKIGFLGKNYFEDLIGANKLTIQQAHLVSGGKFVSNHPDVLELDNAPILKADVQQRVTIPADYAQDPLPYYVDRIFFNEGAGLWFAVDNNDDGIFEIIEKTLKLLGDEGIGTDRAVGNGHFVTTTDTVHLKLPDNATHQLLLSLYCPQQSELNKSLLLMSSYGLLKRGGYLASPDKAEHLTLRKKSVYMFTEGSVFETTAPLTGKIENLKPTYSGLSQNVWRDGLAFSIPTLKPAERI